MSTSKKMIVVQANGVLSSDVLLRVVINNTKLKPKPASSPGCYDYSDTPDMDWIQSLPIVESRLKQLRQCF